MVKNVIVLLKNKTKFYAEFESEYNTLIATHRRTEDMVAGIFARAVEFKAMAKEEADKKANDFIQTIGELQEAKKRLEETVKQLEKECEMATTRTAEAEARAKELSNSLEEKNAEITRIRVSAGDFSDVRAMLEKMLDTINRSGQK